MAVDRKQQMKEITERLEQGVKDIFTSEMYTTYLRTMASRNGWLSISPVVPPISVMTTSASVEEARL